MSHPSEPNLGSWLPNFGKVTIRLNGTSIEINAPIPASCRASKVVSGVPQVSAGLSIGQRGLQTVFFFFFLLRRRGDGGCSM